MAKINFTKKAKIDLEEIWEYTYETWSEKQADRYYNELIEKCQYYKKILNKAETIQGYTKI